MGLFSFLRKPDFFTESEKEKLLEAIRLAEMETSGEVRVYVESRCRFVDPLDRAAEVFWGLKMDHTEERNAVLVYVAMRDHQYAVFADEGIYRKAGEAFWKEKVERMKDRFSKNQVAEAMVEVIADIGKALHSHFPYNKETDRNELPDEIVFGS